MYPILHRYYIFAEHIFNCISQVIKKRVKKCEKKHYVEDAVSAATGLRFVSGIAIGLQNDIILYCYTHERGCGYGKSDVLERRK